MKRCLFLLVLCACASPVWAAAIFTPTTADLLTFQPLPAFTIAAYSDFGVFTSPGAPYGSATMQGIVGYHGANVGGLGTLEWVGVGKTHMDLTGYDTFELVVCNDDNNNWVYRLFAGDECTTNFSGPWVAINDGSHQSISVSLEGLYLDDLAIGFQVGRSDQPDYFHTSCSPPVAASAVIYVDDDAPADPGPGDSLVSDPLENGSEQHPFDAIQEAIDAAVSGTDEVEVAPGTYTGPIDFKGKAIRLYSSGGARVTTLSSSGYTHTVNFVSGEGSSTVFEGFTVTGRSYGDSMYTRDSGPTVTNCIFSSNQGAGLHNSYNSSPTVTNCIFSGNSSTELSGGGMHNNHGARVSVTNCVFIGNNSPLGGGMRNEESSVDVTNCIFSGNSGVYGGGMHNDHSSVSITNCIFSGNSVSGHGGGLMSYAGDLTVTNCTFSSNSAAVGGGMYFDECSPMVVNCILWSDSGGEIYITPGASCSVSYSCVQGGYAGTGNISDDPLFIGGGDYRLQPGSPCIDTGSNSAVPSGITGDLDGNPRIQGAAVDMGAYESPFSAPQVRDIEVTSEDITFAPLPGMPGEPATISATIWNNGPSAAENVKVAFKDYDTEIGSAVVIPIIGAGESVPVSVQYTWTESGFRLITVECDPDNQIAESDETNNSGSKIYQVGEVSQMDASIEVSCNAPAGFAQGKTATIGGEALYSILIAGSPNYEYPAKGSLVSARVIHSSGTTDLPISFTDTEGHFGVSFAVPGQASDSFEVVLSVTDGTLTGTWQRTFAVTGYDDLWVGSSDITFSDENPSLGEAVDIVATIHADAGNAMTFTDVPVVFYAYHTVLGKVQIGESQSIAELLPGGSASLSVTWTNGAEGEYYIEVLIGPVFSDNNNSNNKAGRTLWVGPKPPPQPPAMFTIAASPCYAITGDIVQITVDSREPLPSDNLDSITITDSAGAPVPLLSEIPEQPSSTRWVYRTQALSDSVARGQATITVTGTDAEANLHTGTGHFQVIDTQEPVVRDLWVHSEDVVFSVERPEIGEAVTIVSTIHADPGNTHPSSNIPVSFFAHYGSGSVHQIGQTTWIDELPLGTVEWLVSTTWRNAAAGAYIIEVQLGPGFSDDDNSNNEATRAIIVGNRPPVANPGGPYAGDEGSAVTFDGTGSSDPDGDPLSYTWDFGDGTTGTGATPSHIYADNGTYNVCLTVSDGELSDTQCATTDIANSPPIVGPIDGPVGPVPVGQEVSVTAAFSDPGTVDTHVSSCDWGDGLVEAPHPSTSPVTDSHIYTTAGIYTVQMTVTDDDGDAGRSVFEYVVVYDPTGGFATGHGWVDSPPGAYVPDPTRAGKAQFGFVSRYEKGAKVPTGTTEFRFKAGDLDFYSNSYDWLVINQNGSRAQSKGIGTINGAASYRFQIWAGDGDPDTFRIRIWEEDETTGVETDIYDNGFDQAIGAGSIVIHTK